MVGTADFLDVHQAARMSPCVHAGTDMMHAGTANLTLEQHEVSKCPEYHACALRPEVPPVESHSFLFLWILLSGDSL